MKESTLIDLGLLNQNVLYYDHRLLLYLAVFVTRSPGELLVVFLTSVINCLPPTPIHQDDEALLEMARAALADRRSNLRVQV
jgi:hypothetical protein